MKLFRRRNDNEIIEMIGERCVTQSEFDLVIDNLVSAWVKALKAVDGADNMKEVSKAIAGRIQVLEQLNIALFGADAEKETNSKVGGKKAC